MKKNTQNHGLGKVYSVLKRDYVLLGIGVFVVFLILIWHLQDNYSLKIWGDEFGYWQGAAYFTGKDWSSVAATNSYYGYGYGILLAPIMLLFGHDATLMLRMALLLESVMLSTCVVAAYLCIGYFNAQIKGMTRVLMAMLPVLYPSNVFFVNLTLAEILLITLTWWYSYLGLRFICEKKARYGISLVLISMYMYTVHPRTIVMILVSLILIVWVYRQSLLNLKTLAVVVICVAGMFLASIFKDIYVSDMYSQAQETFYQTNNVQGEASKLIYILTTFDGFYNFILSLIGKFYYFSAGTFMLIPFGIVKCVQALFKYIKKEMDCDQMTGMLFLCLNFMAAYMVDAISMSYGFDSRTDILIYGRYMEHTMGPMIMLGILYLYESVNINVLLTTMGMTSLATIVAERTIGYRASNSHVFFSCTAIADLFESGYNSSGEPLYQALFRCCVVFVILFLALYFKKATNTIYNIALICICIFWVSIGYAVREDQSDWTYRLYEEQRSVLTYIDEDEFGIYDSYVGGFFQFWRVDAKVNYYNTLQEVLDTPKATYIITHVESDDIEEIRAKYDIVYENQRYVLWRTPGKKDRGKSGNKVVIGKMTGTYGGLA